MRKNSTQEVEPKGKGLNYDSQSCSQKTEDSSSSSHQSDLLNLLQLKLNQASQEVDCNVDKFNRIAGGTFSSDKLIRLSGSLIKTFKNFGILEDKTKLDKLAGQIGQLRRLLRLNRLGTNIKDYVNFPMKKNKTLRDYFDLSFKAIMLCSDSLDTIAYLMQLQVIKARNMDSLRKYVANLYFLECLIWACLHLYEFMKKKDIKSKKDSWKKQLNILKYILDSITSHNDFSRRKFTISVKKNSAIGLTSSIYGCEGWHVAMDNFTFIFYYTFCGSFRSYQLFLQQINLQHLELHSFPILLTMHSLHHTQKQQINSQYNQKSKSSKLSQFSSKSFDIFDKFQQSCDSVLQLIDEAENLSAIESDDEETENLIDGEQIREIPNILKYHKKILNNFSYDDLQRSKIIFFIALWGSIVLFTIGIMKSQN